MGEAPPRAIASLKVKSSSRGNGLENGAGFLGVLVCVDGGSVGYEACPIFSDARKLANARCVTVFRYSWGHPFDAVEPAIANQLNALDNPCWWPIRVELDFLATSDRSRYAANFSYCRKDFTSSSMTAIVCLNYLPIPVVIGIVGFLTLQQSE
ncbi:MAG: hypothetical protein V7L23_27025 [Nostoc sp.]|uniref:hypothetical protein n=1 Tax=Nostoc sp. TaxID=1180 RepID=UPI002FF3B1EF